MQVSAAAGIVSAFLDVTPDRYPVAVSEAHINEAMITLAREYDLPFVKTSFNFAMSAPEVVGSDPVWLQFPGSVSLDIFDDGELAFDYAIAAWRSPYKLANKLIAVTYEELIDEYGDDEGSVPAAYAIFGGRFIVRPVPAAGIVYNLRVLWSGRTRYAASSDEPQILKNAEWGVIYRACEVASGWLLEDARIPLFNRGRTEQMEAIGITMSMREDEGGTLMVEP